jgi:predicted metalloprotease
MDWQPGNMSSDVEDRRGDDSGGGGGGGFNIGGGGGIGIVGFVVLLVLSLVTGRNFLGGLFGGGSNAAPTQQTQPLNGSGTSAAAAPDGDRDAHLISFVLDDAQKTWTQIFAAEGKQYRHAKLVLYNGTTYSGCGTAQAQTGPFYCPQDEKVYIDLSFWNELRQLGGDSADFAQAYVVTHEIGHHVQKLLGIEGKAQSLMQDRSQRSAVSVDLELQADCFAGVWAHSTEQRKIVNSSDVADALKAASAVGDDHIAKMSGRAVSPENFTHGTSAQRQQWFNAGLNGGTIESCTTFNGNLAP